MGSYLDNWDGWGYRKIQAKHGWGPSDAAATRETLLTPWKTSKQEEPAGSTSLRFTGFEYSRGGALCRRVVVVEFGSADSEVPKGIITSFGAYQGEAP